MSKANIFCIIVAGGRGTRMGTEIPKQFLLLGDQPVLMYSIRAFRTALPGIPIILALPEDQHKNWMELCQEYHFAEPHTLVAGGETRFQSVKNCLDTIPGSGFVAIHDGVRPLILPETIRHLFDEAAIHSNAIPVISPMDSLRWKSEKENHILDRNYVKIIQTPQVFELNKLKAAYVQSYEEAFTDDASVWENAGNAVHLAPGQETNIKITKPMDLMIAQSLLRLISPGETS